MLSWVGKRPLREVQAFPSQLVERFAPESPDGIVAGGTYDLEASAGDRPAAIRITDMLGRAEYDTGAYSSPRRFSR